MIKTTRQQREALFKVFQRDFPGWISPTKRVRHSELCKYGAVPHDYRGAQEFAKERPDLIVKVPSLQYRRFRKKVQPYFGDTCVMVPFAGMWLGIETDGYTHS